MTSYTSNFIVAIQGSIGSYLGRFGKYPQGFAVNPNTLNRLLADSEVAYSPYSHKREGAVINGYPIYGYDEVLEGIVAPLDVRRANLIVSEGGQYVQWSVERLKSEELYVSPWLHTGSEVAIPGYEKTTSDAQPEFSGWKMPPLPTSQPSPTPKTVGFYNRRKRIIG